ncbi:hypothetical protein BSLG_000219 [Batrachochytrium salamandrivorans]|nr:hypothetical protein BASA81_005454 [Batrachochytrium salamandrivorans]KAJ1344696.1 hypothetical protein BSLG_000219 [Batrachochytrium salamandrivorans]
MNSPSRNPLHRAGTHKTSSLLLSAALANQVSDKAFLVSPMSKAAVRATTITSNRQSKPESEKENMDSPYKRKRIPPREFWRVGDQDSQSDNDGDAMEPVQLDAEKPSHTTAAVVNSKRSSKPASKLHSSGDASHGTSLTTSDVKSSNTLFKKPTAAPTRPSADARADHTSSSIVDIPSGDELVDSKVRRKKLRKRAKRSNDATCTPNTNETMASATTLGLDAEDPNGLVSEVVPIARSDDSLADTEVDHQIQASPASIQKEASAVDAQVPSEPLSVPKPLIQKSSKGAQMLHVAADIPTVSELQIPKQPLSYHRSSRDAVKMHSKATMTVAISTPTPHMDDTEISKIKCDLEVARRQYKELCDIGIVEAEAKFREFQLAADERYHTSIAYAEELEKENRRLLERIDALSAENVELRQSALMSKKESRSVQTDDHDVSKEVVDKQVHDSYVEESREIQTRYEVETTDLRKEVDALKSRLAESVALSVQDKCTDDPKVSSGILEKTCRVYKAFTGIHIQSVDRVVRSMEDSDGESSDQPFDEFKCLQKGPGQDIVFSFFVPCNKDWLTCIFTPESVTQADDVKKRHVELPMFMQEEIEFTLDMTQCFFSRITAYLYDS